MTLRRALEVAIEDCNGEEHTIAAALLARFLERLPELEEHMSFGHETVPVSLLASILGEET